MHEYEVRPRKGHRGVDLISDALPFGRLWCGEPNAVANAVGYAKHRSRSHNAVIRGLRCEGQRDRNARTQGRFQRSRRSPAPGRFHVSATFTTFTITIVAYRSTVVSVLRMGAVRPVVDVHTGTFWAALLFFAADCGTVFRFCWLNLFILRLDDVAHSRQTFWMVALQKLD